MAKWDAGSITVNDVKVPVQADDYNGQWTAEYAGQSLSFETRAQLERKLSALTRKTKVTVEIHVIRVREYRGWGPGDVTVTRGVLTGIHSGTGNVLAAWTVRGTVQKEQITRDSEVIYVGGDTSDEALKEYNQIEKDLAVLRERLTEWLKLHKIDPKDAVQRAIDAVSGTDER